MIRALIARFGAACLDLARTLSPAVRNAIIGLHPCGRNASINACSFAMPGDCSFCEALLDPVQVTYFHGDGSAVTRVL